MFRHDAVQDGKSNREVLTPGRTGKVPLLARRLRRHLILLIIIGSCCGIGTSCIRPPKSSYEGYRYLIIAPQTAMVAVQDFADYKESKGFLVDLVSLEEILTSSPGEDDPEKIRNYLVGYSALTLEREFVLLVGSIDTIPMRIAHTDPNDHDASDVPTDFYYEDLTGNWDADGDGYFGEYGEDMNQATEDYGAEVYVGRIPWDENEQIQSICSTIIQYEEDTSARMKHALVAGATIEFDCDTSIPMNMAKVLIFNPSGYATTTLYENCPSANPDYDLTMENFLWQWDTINPGVVFMFSHGNPHASTLGPGSWWEHYIDINNLPQGEQPAVVSGFGCAIGSPDSYLPSLGRTLVRDGIAASFLGASRNTWYGDNPLPVLFGGVQSALSLIWNGEALVEAKIRWIDYYAKTERVPHNMPGPEFHQNLFLLMLYGDPSIQLR